MQRRWVFSLIVGAVLGAVAVTPCWADNNHDDTSSSGQPSYAPLSEQPIQPPGAEMSPSGNIIGYQPIPNSALPTAASVQQMTASVTAGRARGARPTTYDYTTWLVGSGPYTLGRDDVIHVQVRSQPDFSGDFIVGPDGSIQYNYLGDIPVLGMTKYEVEQVLGKMLERYVRVPQVNVMILAYNSKSVYVIGEVSRPGKYIMRGDTIKLREAIIAAGLPTFDAALGRTHVIKPDITKPRDRKVNLKKILYSGKLEEDIDLYPGEIIVVPSKVLSAVNRFLSQLLNPITHAASAAAIGAAL